MPLEEAAGLRGGGGFVWLGLFDPDAEELAKMREAFGLHELAIEDARVLHRRPKIESYGQDVRLVVVRTVRYDDEAEEVEFGEISIFVAPTFVITVRQGVASELRAARRRLEQRPDLLTLGAAPEFLGDFPLTILDDFPSPFADLPGGALPAARLTGEGIPSSALFMDCPMRSLSCLASSMLCRGVGMVMAICTKEPSWINPPTARPVQRVVS